MKFDKTIHPRAFRDGVQEVVLNNWADLDVCFVKWLIRTGHLSLSKTPIKNHAGRGKYFINDQKAHSTPYFDGDWKQVGVFYVDTKYNAESHVKNILAALTQLKVQNPQLSLAFRTDE